VTRSCRAKIEQFTNQAFAVTRDQLGERQAERRNQALRLARLSGNRGAYVPAVTRCATEDVRESILALADAYVEAFTLFGVPSEGGPKVPSGHQLNKLLGVPPLALSLKSSVIQRFANRLRTKRRGMSIERWAFDALRIGRGDAQVEAPKN